MDEEGVFDSRLGTPVTQEDLDTDNASGDEESSVERVCYMCLQPNVLHFLSCKCEGKRYACQHHRCPCGRDMYQCYVTLSSLRAYSLRRSSIGTTVSDV